MDIVTSTGAVYKPGAGVNVGAATVCPPVGVKTWKPRYSNVLTGYEVQSAKLKTTVGLAILLLRTKVTSIPQFSTWLTIPTTSI